jgi:hypothetical protein
MSRKPPRPSIREQVQRELWARAAGRCQFQGCNKVLYTDELTQKRSNLAFISHIVAYSPTGPRGDPIRSKLLEKDIKNLMLTCRKCAKIIDDTSRVAEFPEERLLEFKRAHERRIRTLTGITEDAQTHVVLLQASIDARDFDIDQTAAFQAILPKYPAEENAEIIDLTGLAISTTTNGFFAATAQCITERTNDLLRRRPHGRSIRSLSVFALAPVPLLVHFGHLLGDLHNVDLYQRHRGTQNWMWKEDEEPQEFYQVLVPAVAEGDVREIALVLSVSAQVNHDEVAKALGSDPIIYEMRAERPSSDFLRSRTRLEVFGYEIRKLLHDIRQESGHERLIHLFAAVPAPLAVEFGRAVKGFHSVFHTYEYQKDTCTYIPGLTINSREAML